VREKTHPCKIHENGVRVVEVQEASIKALIPIKLAVESAIIHFEPQDCNNILCKFYHLCKPQGLRKGDKCKIVSLGRKLYAKIPCKRPLIEAVLRRVTL